LATELLLFGGPDAGHTFRFFVPPERYFDDHPEYFAMDSERNALLRHGETPALAGLKSLRKIKAREGQYGN